MSLDSIRARILPIISLLFSFKGRISVGQFWRGNLLVAAAVGCAILLLPTEFAGFPFAIFVLPVVFWGGTALQVKRAHDLGKSGASIWGLWVGWSLYFTPGDPHANAYGPPIASRAD